MFLKIFKNTKNISPGLYRGKIFSDFVTAFVVIGGLKQAK